RCPPGLLSKTEKILEYTAVAATALRDAAGATQMPFLNSMCALSSTIVAMVQNTRIHRERYLRIVEDDIRSPKLLEEVAQYAGILQKFHACLRAQEELGTFKRFFKQSEMATQLDSCETELRAALHGFTMNYGVGIASSLWELDVDTEQQLISSQSVSSDNGSSMPRKETIAHHLVSLTKNCESSDSFSLLPASPKIFYGRAVELTDIIETLADGKTTLALAALHHPTIVEKYAFKYFISCESANTHADMVTTIGLHLGLEPSRQLAKAIVHHFVQCNSCLLVLDNLETPWEPLESRGQVEDFLSLLTDIPNLALLVTMRGAERPGKVKWHRPFLAPLEPLSASASRQIFLEVADDPASGEESALHDLLDLSGSLPLAVSLMASIASFEGYSGTLSRWQIENIALLSDGHDKRSNLEKSIVLSLSSPRLSSSPHAKISLLCFPCSLTGSGQRSSWQATSPFPTSGSPRPSPFASTSDVSIRPSAPISRPLSYIFPGPARALELDPPTSVGKSQLQLVGYLGNINALMLNELITDDRAALKAIGYSIVTLDEFSAVMIKGNSPLFQRLPHLIEVTGDPVLRWRYGRRCLRNPDSLHSLSEDPDVWIEDGAKYFGSGNHSAGEAVPFYDAVAWHHHNPRFLNIPKAIEFNRRAFALAQEAADVELQLMALKTEYNIAYRCGGHRSTNPNCAESPRSRQVRDESKLCGSGLARIGGVGQHLYRQSASSTRPLGLRIAWPREGVIVLLRECRATALSRGPIRECPRRISAVSGKSRGIYPDLQGFCLASLGEPRHAMHDTAETFHWAVLSLAFVRKMKEPVGILNSLRRLANVHIALHDDETALHLFRAALEGGIAIGIHRLKAECMVGIGDILVRRGDLMQAKEMWAAACPLFVRSSRMKDAAAVQVRLQQLATNSGSKLETLLTNDV
ncbi:hypothetical protein B0H14DRAFT_2757706, partial [Mycena olivaceomarginata]